MTSFVKVEKNQKSAPTESQFTEAMEAVGGTVISISGDNACRKVEFTGSVNHNNFQNKLEEIVPNSRKTSWNFVWGDG